MDYIEIILRGYSNENDREFLSKYFIRESKRAEKEFYDYEVFFSGLLNAIKTLKNEYETRLFKRKNELYFMLDGAKNGTLNYSDSENKSIEELHKQTIEYCESELLEISFENFPLNLFHFTNSIYKGFLNFSEVLFIENKITEAHNELKEPQQIVNELFDLFSNTKEVPTNSSYYSISTPQNNIDAFLINDLNIEIFEYIEGIQYTGKPNTLEYFNLLFSEFNFFVENVNNYLKIKEHFIIPELKTTLKDDESLYLKSLLYFKLIDLIKYSFPIENRKNIIKKTCEHIEKINQLLVDFNFPTVHCPDDFQLLREDFEKLDYKSQLIEWTNIKYAILQDEQENTYTKKEALVILKKIDFEIERIEKLIEIKQTQQPELSNFTKPKDGIQEVLTDEIYYSILEKCTIEAFECLKLIDFYPKDGSKAIWDVSSLTITKGDGLPTKIDNELNRKLYIKENMRVTFLLAIERYSEEFHNKYSITRSVFYKKCYQSLLVKKSQSSLWKTPDLGIDINNPDVLTFVWNMRHDIEGRSIETKESNTKTQNFSDTSTVEKSQKSKPQGKTLQQFFKEGIDPKIINTLQIKYKDLNGKKMAYLIYLLHKEFKLINYSLRGTKDNRKRFVNEFTGKNINNIEGINKIFNPNEITLGIDKYHKDNDYITIQNEIQTILNPIK